MVKEYGPDEQWKHFLRMFLIIAVGLGFFVGLGILLDDGPALGPCEEYKTQEAFELCADSVINQLP